MTPLFFATVGQETDQPMLPIGRMSPQTRDQWIIFGAITVVILCVICWAVFFRKRPRHKRGHIKRDRHSFRAGLIEGWTELRRILALRERQRKRVRHRPRNPTRAEVGGLPQARDESDPAAGGDDPAPRSNL